MQKFHDLKKIYHAKKQQKVKVNLDEAKTIKTKKRTFNDFLKFKTKGWRGERVLPRNKILTGDFSLTVTNRIFTSFQLALHFRKMCLSSPV